MIKQIAFILVICTIGCASEKQLQKAETKLAHAGRLAKICADRFPSRDSIIVKDSVITDTLLLGEYIFDTIRVNDTVYVTKRDTLVKIKTVYKAIYKERTDKIEAVQVELDKCVTNFAELSIGMMETQKELDKAKKDAKTYFWWFWIVVVLSIAWTFRKLIARYVIR